MTTSTGNGPRSLIISPNLEALLEHDERTRRKMKGGSWSTTSTGSTGSGEPVVQSLPPPPRGPRKTPTSPKNENGERSPRNLSSDAPAPDSLPTTPVSSATSSTSTPNPYVNPSPSFGDVLSTEEKLIRVPPRSSSILHSPSLICSSTPRLELDRSEEDHDLPESPGDSLRRDGWKQLKSVDRLLSRGKNAFGIFVDSSQKEASGSSVPSPSSPSPRTTLQERAQRNKGKLLKLREVPKSESMSRHSRSRSISSASSPPLTGDPADDVSISSTIRFPSTSDHSHSQFYEAPDRRVSFIELVSPLQPEFSMAHDSPHDPPSKPAKPPIPTSPKPDFRSSPHLALRRSMSKPRDQSNLLDAASRADLIRKSRKLAQVFGQTPEARALSQSDRSSFLDIGSRHARTSTDNSRKKQIPVWPPAEGTQYITASGRRHSSPLTPDQFSFLSHITSDDNKSDIEIGPQQGSPSSDLAVSKSAADSPTSYIDLSEEEVVDDGISAIISGDTVKKRRHSSTQSMFENMTPEQQAEEERRRKREKLAKLHRFLGSRVPTNLVLGVDDSFSLPPEMSTSDAVNRKVWLKRRRSSSAAVFPSNWDDDLERLKEDLNVQEKAINVRRAVKMEKVFGVAPPQTLYHTRHTPSPSLSVPFLGQSVSRSLSPELQSGRNVNQSSYKSKSKKADRPGTSESSKQLIPKGRSSEDHGDNVSDIQGQRASLVYTHYQHSLNSLNDIIDRDDKESLAELHQYLNNSDPPATPPLQDFTRVKDRPTSIASVRSERRHSLPARTSMLSLVSEYSISSPKPEVTDFQLRRRRAAKLTQFFGVDYRDLIRDVLDSIENGLEHERRRGTLKPEEADDLLQKLRNLKTKRDGIY